MRVIEERGALEALSNEQGGDLTLEGDLRLECSVDLRGTLRVLGRLEAALRLSAGSLEVTGALLTHDDCEVRAGVLIEGEAKIEGALTVGGDAIFQGAVGVEGDLRIGGALRSKAALTVGGDAQVESDLQLDSDLRVRGALEVGSFLNVDGDLDVGGALIAGGFSRVAGSARIGASVCADDDLSVEGSLRVGANLDVGGGLATTGDLEVTGTLEVARTLRCGGDATIGDGAEVGGDVHTQGLRCGGSTRLRETLFAEGDVHVAGDLHVGGSAFARRLAADGDIVVSGEIAAQVVERFLKSVPPIESISFFTRLETPTPPHVSPAAWRGTLRALGRALCRSRDRAVFLVGDVGVGKSAAVALLAQEAANDIGCRGLRGAQFVQLDVDALQRASNADRSILSELSRALGELSRHASVVLVADHLHYLSRGEWLVTELTKALRPWVMAGALRLILVTTTAHYRAQFKEDSLFGERTQVVTLDELPEDALRVVVASAARSLLQASGLEVTDEAVAASVRLGSVRSLRQRPPASSLRLIDEARIEAEDEGSTHIGARQLHEVAPFKASEQGQFDLAVLRSLEDELNRQVLGQEEAVAAVARRIRLAKMGLDRRPRRPDGVFLLLGPSGVGKTELAKAVTRVLYGDLSRLVRLDMSEYMAEHEYAKIIGPPPGYAGYGEEGQLTGAVERIGHGVVLLDEIEKANGALLNIFLQVFDEGFLTDSRGKRVDFSECIILMTSNLGRELWSGERKVLGFDRGVGPDEPSARQVLNHLLRVLPAEFVNRIDVLVPFRALSVDDLRTIVKKLLREERERWQRRGKVLTFSDEVCDVLVNDGYEPRLGARHLERNLERHVIQRLSEAALGDDWADIQRVHVALEGGAITLTFS